MASASDADATTAAFAAAAADVRVPGPSATVYRECAFTFDTPYSPGGIYLSLQSLTAISTRLLSRERRTTGERLFLHESWRRVRVPSDVREGVDTSGGVLRVTLGQDAFEVVKDTAVVLFVGEPEDSASIRVSWPSGAAQLPALLSRVVESVCAAPSAEDARPSGGASVFEDAPKESRYAATLQQLPAGSTRVSSSPSEWVCAFCDQRSGLWLNLGTGVVGCGRRNWDGTGGNGHALAHFQETGGVFPLCVKLGTITPAGGDVYSYAADEDDMVTDPLLGQHLAHWGINIMKLEKTEKTMAELSDELNKSYDWSRITEAGKELVPVTGPGLIGMENLGNSCYMNSVVQVLGAIPEVQQLYASPERVERLRASARDPRTRMDDLLLQTSKLFAGIHDTAYAIDPEYHAYLVAKEHARVTGGPKAADEMQPPERFSVPPQAGAACGYIVPRMFRSVMGKGHPDFSSAQQQDAQQYLDWLFSQLEKAANSGRDRFPALADGRTRSPADLFTFKVETRVEDTQSGTVAYRTSSERFWRLNIPTERATNTAEVAAAQAAVHAEAVAAVAARHGESTEDVAAAIAPSDASVSSAPSDSKVPVSSEELRAMPVKKPRTAVSRDEEIARLERSLAAERVPKLNVPFEACVSSFLSAGTVEGFQSPVTGARGIALTQTRFATFPRYLVLQLNRYQLAADWTTVKIDAAVPVPTRLDLESLGLRGRGLQPGETPMPSGEDRPAPRAAAAPQPDEALVAQLMALDFPHGACCRAALATGNSGVEPAMEWILSHLEDPDFTAPYEPPAAAPAPAPAPAAAGSFDEGLVSMLMDMGFDRERVSHALTATGGNGERAADWLFSHMDEPLPQPAAAPAVSAPETSDASEDASSPGTYELVGIISHLGRSTSSGHYVCHIRRSPSDASPSSPAAPRWFFFNDERVAESAAPPLEFGFLYVYRRV